MLKISWIPTNQTNKETLCLTNWVREQQVTSSLTSLDPWTSPLLPSSCPHRYSRRLKSSEWACCTCPSSRDELVVHMLLFTSCRKKEFKIGASLLGTVAPCWASLKAQLVVKHLAGLLSATINHSQHIWNSSAIAFLPSFFPNRFGEVGQPPQMKTFSRGRTCWSSTWRFRTQKSKCRS